MDLRPGMKGQASCGKVRISGDAVDVYQGLTTSLVGQELAPRPPQNLDDRHMLGAKEESTNYSLLGPVFGPANIHEPLKV